MSRIEVLLVHDGSVIFGIFWDWEAAERFAGRLPVKAQITELEGPGKIEPVDLLEV